MRNLIGLRAAAEAFAAASVVLVAVTFAAANELPGPLAPQSLPPAQPTHDNKPAEPLFKATGGPFIGVAAAELIGASQARSPIVRAESRLSTYGDVIAWTGNQTYTIDPAREVYVVVVSANLQTRGADLRPSATCLSYTTVIDATTGQVFMIRCGDGLWPSSLPRGFSP